MATQPLESRVSNPSAATATETGSGGAAVFTLDFELAWGAHAWTEHPEKLAHLSDGRKIAAKLLEIFARYDISATWATVGHLFIRPEDCVDGRYPAKGLPVPRYPWLKRAWLEGIPRCDEPAGGAYYAPEIVDAICNCPVYQELATHTFTHLEAGYPETTAEVFRAELELCAKLIEQRGRSLKSIVFPRNLPSHLDLCREIGMTSYRGFNSEWYWLGLGQQMTRYRTTFWRSMRVLSTALRLADDKLRLAPPLPPAQKVDGLWRLPHSYFFPPNQRLARFTSANDRVRKAVKGLDLAAKRGRLFVLFTHPINLLPVHGKLLDAFEQVCAHAAKLRDAGRIEIVTMQDAAERLEAGAAPIGWIK